MSRRRKKTLGRYDGNLDKKNSTTNFKQSPQKKKRRRRMMKAIPPKMKE
jgi:hypothetical protein